MNAKYVRMHLMRFMVGTCLLPWFVSIAFADDRQECVGRYELTLPGEVEVATTKFILGGRYIEHPIQFPNGDAAPLSSFFSDGDFEIAMATSNSSYQRIMREVGADLEGSGIHYTAPGVRIRRNDTIFFLGDGFGEFYLYMEPLFVSFHTTDSPTDVGEKSAENVEARLTSTLSDLKIRQGGEIPDGPGVCLPELFIGKKENDSRKIGVTFRLIRHPDVTIFLLDDNSRARADLTSRQKNEFVWTYSGLGKKVKLAHNPIPFHSVELDGRKGVGSFGTITRDDGSTDYGYLATVQGDPKAAVDTPDLTLLVERTAKNARGKAPMSPDELKQIAKDIAASVKRRPVH